MGGDGGRKEELLLVTRMVGAAGAGLLRGEDEPPCSHPFPAPFLRDTTEERAPRATGPVGQVPIPGCRVTPCFLPSCRPSPKPAGPSAPKAPPPLPQHRPPWPPPAAPRARPGWLCPSDRTEGAGRFSCAPVPRHPLPRPSLHPQSAWLRAARPRGQHHRDEQWGPRIPPGEGRLMERGPQELAHPSAPAQHLLHHRATVLTKDTKGRCHPPSCPRGAGSAWEWPRGAEGGGLLTLSAPTSWGRMQSPRIISRPDPVTQAEQFSGNKPIAQCNLRAAGDYLLQTLFFFFCVCVRVLILSHFPFSPNESNREGSVIIFHTASGRGLSQAGCSIGHPCWGQWGGTRDPTAAPAKGPSPFLPPSPATHPSLQRRSVPTRCTQSPPMSRSPHVQRPGVPRCHLGMWLELLGSLCCAPSRAKNHFATALPGWWPREPEPALG